jgi:uncharacterized tellurite resistance protein B-like protein
VLLNRLKSLLAAPPVDKGPTEALSTALLLLELARADFDLGVVELARVRELLASRYGLDAAALDRLIAQADARARVSVSLHEYTGSLHAALDGDGKRALIAMLWQVAYADGRVDKHEEHLLRRLADLLFIPMADYVRAREAAEAAAGTDA